MSNELILRRQDLIMNPTPRLPICLVLDCSPSMSGETKYGSPVQQTNPRPIDELNEGIRTFFEELHEDDIAKYSVEIAIVVFSGTAEKILDFGSLDRIAQSPTVQLDMKRGGTSIGKGVELALNLLNSRKKEYKEAGVDYYQPWMVLMTDGRPTDDSHMHVYPLVVEQMNAGKLIVFSIGIGVGAAMDVLAKFSPKRDPLKLKGLCFREFFVWLSKSVSATSQSIPGESIPLDVEGIKGWSTL